MNRIYYFGKNNKKIFKSKGGYLEPDRIKHYEDCYGKLQAVRYGNIIIRPDNGATNE